jgi:outer membrane protein assembly factor BamB
VGSFDGWQHFEERGSVRLFMIVVVLMAFAPSAVASSASTSVRITLSKTKAPPTALFVVGGSGFGASESVALSFDTTLLANAPTDGNGSFAAQVEVPGSALPGAHTIVAEGQTSELRASRPFTVRTNWIQFRYDNRHSGFNPFENVLDPGNVAIGGPVFSSPALATGKVYIGSGEGWVYALNATTGDPVWSTPTRAGVVSSPAVVGGIVFIGSNDGTVYALSARSGVVLWSTLTAAGLFSSPAVASGVVYSSSNGSLYALSAATGALLWNTPIGSGSFSLSSPAVANGVVYIGSNNGAVYALSAASGAVLWTGPTGGPVYSSPAVANGGVYVGSYDHKLYAFHLQGTP